MLQGGDLMGETILAAMVTGVVTLAVCLVNNYFQQSKTRALLEYKLNDLTERVNKHNDLIEREPRKVPEEHPLAWDPCGNHQEAARADREPGDDPEVCLYPW